MARNQRNFTLKSDHGEALRFAGMDASERLGGLFEFRLRAVSPDPKLDLVAMLGKPMAVHMQMPDGFERWFHGIAIEAAQGSAVHAAEAGNATAMLRLARKYLRGEDFAQDYELALRWFKRSAESGNDDALYHVGVMYLKGMGTEADVGEARSWLERSAAAGCDKASELLSGI